jgi:hypothetical protein
VTITFVTFDPFTVPDPFATVQFLLAGGTATVP